jgi:hypothetical protein
MDGQLTKIVQDRSRPGQGRSQLPTQDSRGGTARSGALAFVEEANALLGEAANASTLLLTYRRRLWSNGRYEILSLVLKQPDDQPTGLYFLIDPVSGKSQWQMTHGREEHGGAWQRFEPSLLDDRPAFVKTKVLDLVAQLR